MDMDKVHSFVIRQFTMLYIITSTRGQYSVMFIHKYRRIFYPLWHTVNTGGKMMKTISWEMMERFYFPTELGAIDEISEVKITPQWQQQQVDESVRLSGIYHIAARLKFDRTKGIQATEGIFIDQLDLEGQNGYFEYALPLEVDLPKEKVDGPSLNLHVDDVLFFVYDGDGCTFKWQVSCQCDTPAVQEPVKVLVVEKPAKPEPVAIEKPAVVKPAKPAVVRSEEQVVIEKPVKLVVKPTEPVVIDKPATPVVKAPAAPRALVEKPQVIVEQQVETPQSVVLENETTADDFYAELAEAYSLFSVSSNKVR